MDKKKNKNSSSLLQRTKRDISKYKSLYLLIIQVVVWYLLFHYKPMYGVVIAFQDYRPRRGIMGSEWVGLKHLPIHVISGIWQGLGWGAIIYIAALANVDQELYDAASIDGANRWKQTIYVTIPSIMPTIVIMLLLRLGSIMNVGYEKIILLYNEGIYETADVISTYVYRKGLLDSQYSYSAAVGLFNTVINFMLVMIFNKIHFDHIISDLACGCSFFQ